MTGFNRLPFALLFQRPASIYVPYLLLFRLFCFFAVLVNCAESRLPNISSQNLAFTSKLPWHPLASSCTAKVSTPREEEEGESPAHARSLTLTCIAAVLAWHTRGSPKSAIAADCTTPIQAWNKFSSAFLHQIRILKIVTAKVLCSRLYFPSLSW